MSHLPIIFQRISLSFISKLCFADFSGQICYGQKIAIIGRNGSGKSSLLKMLQQKIFPSEGELILPSNLSIANVPQIVDGFEDLSGGQKFDKAFSLALSAFPNCLLLDEPTNHLDVRRRNSLMKRLQHTQSTVIIATHDIELMNNCVDELWHIENGRIEIFRGPYDEYMQRNIHIKQKLERKLVQLQHKKKDAHHALMKEQERASKRKKYGEKKYDGDKLAYLSAKGRGELTHAHRKKDISECRNAISSEMQNLYIPENLRPNFLLNPLLKTSGNILSVRQGNIAYDDVIIQDISIDIAATDVVVVGGDNGSGKTSFVQAILGSNHLKRCGDWHVPALNNIGYLDQNYNNLNPELSILEISRMTAPHLFHHELRQHLNHFLFRKNEEVNNKIANLSGGEKARASLAILALKPAQLLILDEVTNNVDFETRQHIIQVLRSYPAAIIIISHDKDFVHQLNIDASYLIEKRKLVRE